MNAQASMGLINAIEEGFPVDNWIINSIHVWPIIRIMLYFELKDLPVNGRIEASRRSPLLNKPVAAINILKGLKNYIRAYFFDFKNNAKPDRHADVIFLGDQVSRILLNGLWYDRLCEPIIEYIEQSGRTYFHMDPYHKYRVPRHNASMFIQPYLDLAEVKSSFLARKTNLNAEQMHIYSGIVSFLSDKKLDAIMPKPEQILKLAILVRLIADFYKKILHKVNPSAAFAVEYYNAKGMAFNLACREFGIRSVDIPHGNHWELHAAYGRWNRLPKEGYELLPSIFWCWSNDEAGFIKKWTETVSEWHNPLVGGNLWLDLWKKGGNDFIDNYDDMIIKIKTLNPNTTHILCTYEFDYMELVDIIKKSPASWHWWIRLHPCKLERREEIRSLIESWGITNYELDNATDIPLYGLLRHVDVHLTEYSSTVIEAEESGVPSVITRDAGTEAFPIQVSSGWVLPAYSIEEIIKAVYRQLERKTSLPRMQKDTQPDISDVIESLFSQARAVV
jgi:hypothetical protein